MHHCFRIFAGVLFVLLFTASGKANPALKDYANFEALAARLKKLDESDLVRLTSLAKTLGGRDVYLLTLGTGELDTKPAILIVGDVAPTEITGAEAMVRVAEQLVARAGSDEKVKELLARRTIYLLPRPSPDASEKCFTAPFREPGGNARPTDDDRDGKSGEDPPDDLNGDGWITMLRVADPAGEFFPHPDEPRVLIKADRGKNERGQYRVLTEGRDNDGDEAFNEDAGDGVSFNRNFTYNYVPFQPGTGPHQVSELETRAVADFCFDHPNISAVWTMTPEDNLLHPWKPDGQKDRARIRTTILSADAPYQDFLASMYQKLRTAKGPPTSPKGEGSFSEWAYFHYGRGSLATRVWWIPTVEPKEGEKKIEEKRGADEINALRYFAANSIDGFVPWTSIEHPDFPGQKVEVGGFKPFYRAHPSVAQLDEIAKAQVEFLLQAEALAPKLAIDKLKAESLGGGVVRLTATVRNDGYFPTMSEMGETNRQMHPLQIAWAVPDKTQWLQGSQRSRLPRLSGPGGETERTWLVRLPEPLPKELKVEVFAPALGRSSATVEVK